MANRFIDPSDPRHWDHNQHVEHMQLLEDIGTAILSAYTTSPHGHTFKGRLIDHHGKIGYSFLLTLGNSAADIWIDPLQPSSDPHNFIDAVYLTIETTHQMKLRRAQEMLATADIGDRLQTPFREHFERREQKPGFYTLNTFINKRTN